MNNMFGANMSGPDDRDRRRVVTFSNECGEGPGARSGGSSTSAMAAASATTSNPSSPAPATALHGYAGGDMHERNSPASVTPVGANAAGTGNSPVPVHFLCRLGTGATARHLHTKEEVLELARQQSLKTKVSVPVRGRMDVGDFLVVLLDSVQGVSLDRVTSATEVSVAEAVRLVGTGAMEWDEKV